MEGLAHLVPEYLKHKGEMDHLTHQGSVLANTLLPPIKSISVKYSRVIIGERAILCYC